MANDNPHRRAFLRGLKEAKRHFPLLRERWPKAFPIQALDVRPLGSEAVRAIAEEMGWDRSYARGALCVWKRRQAYCRAILAHPERIALDGTPCGETVDDKARELALADLKTMRDRRKREPGETRKPAPIAQEAARAADAAAGFPPVEPDKTPEPPAAPKAKIAPEETPKAMRMRLAAEAKAAKRARQMTLRSHGWPP